MSRTRSGLFVFVIATSATACRNDNQPTDLEPPAPATKTVEEPAVEASDTADTSGSTGGATIDPETVTPKTAPGDAGVTEPNRAARTSTPGTRRTPAPTTVNPSEPASQAPSGDDPPPPAISDTAAGTGTTNTGANSENAGTGGGAGTQPQPQPPR